MTAAIACAALGKRYADGTLGLDGVTLEVPAGTCLALVGPNGAGKSTLLNLVLGFIRPTAGRLTVLGHEQVERAHGRIGYLPDAPSPEPGLTGRAWLGHVARIAGLPGPADAAERALAEVDLAQAAGRRMSGFSRGMLQRVGLAQALLGEPDLLLLDEPTSGLDPESQVHIREVIRSRLRAGVTVVLSSHNLAEVETLCDAVAVLHRGRLLAAAPVADLRETGPHVEIEVAGGPAAELTAALGLDALGVEVRDGRLVLSTAAQALVLGRLLAAGVEIVSLNPARRSLERAYLKVIGLP